MSEIFATTAFPRSLQSFFGQLNKAPRYEDAKARVWIIKAQQGDEVAKNQLAMSCMGYIFSYAQEYLKKSSETDIMEIISSASEGLAKAIPAYDLNKTASFLTFAKYYMRTAILTGIEEDNLIIHSHRAIENERKVRKFCEMFLKVNECEPTVDMVCEGANVSRTYAISAREHQFGSHTNMRSIDDWEVINRSEEPGNTYSQYRMELDNRLKKLDRRKREMFCAFHGIDMESMTLAEIADIHHCSASRVSQIVKEATLEIQHLRAA